MLNSHQNGWKIGALANDPEKLIVAEDVLLCCALWRS